MKKVTTVVQSKADAPSKRKPAVNSRALTSKANATSTTRVAKAPRPAHALLIEARLDNEHWGKRIIAAEKRGKFTPKDQRDAMSWVDCACGRQDPRIARMRDGTPFDSRLSTLGGKFSRCVRAEAHEGAARILISIEARAKIVLAETLAVKK